MQLIGIVRDLLEMIDALLILITPCLKQANLDAKFLEFPLLRKDGCGSFAIGA